MQTLWKLPLWSGYRSVGTDYSAVPLREGDEKMKNWSVSLAKKNRKPGAEDVESQTLIGESAAAAAGGATSAVASTATTAGFIVGVGLFIAAVWLSGRCGLDK